MGENYPLTCFFNVYGRTTICQVTGYLMMTKIVMVSDFKEFMSGREIDFF